MKVRKSINFFTKENADYTGRNIKVLFHFKSMQADKVLIYPVRKTADYLFSKERGSFWKFVGACREMLYCFHYSEALTPVVKKLWTFYLLYR